MNTATEHSNLYTILLPTLWNQDAYYSNEYSYSQYCPVITTTGKRTIVGCVAVASGQILNYWFTQGYDLSLTLTDEYAYTTSTSITINATDAAATRYGYLSFKRINQLLADYEGYGTPTAGDDGHIAALLFATAIVVKATFNAGSTGAVPSTAPYQWAGFDSGGLRVTEDNRYFFNFDGTITDAGYAILIDQINRGLVVQASIPGHAVVVDGYNPTNGTFHVNYGWGNDKATRWYSRDEMHKIGFSAFILDVFPEFDDKPLMVTSAGVYGVGTLMRVFEQASALSVTCRVEFSASVQNASLTLSGTLYLSGRVTFENFNLKLQINLGETRYYGFSISSGVTFKTFSGSMTVSSSSHAYAISSLGLSIASLSGEVRVSSETGTAAAFRVGGDSSITVNNGYVISTSKSSNYGIYTSNNDAITLTVNGGGFYTGQYAVTGSTYAASLGVIRNALAGYAQSGVAALTGITTTLGYAVYAGSGNDSITLKNGAVLVGNLSVGGGVNTLSIESGSTWVNTGVAGTSLAITLNLTAACSSALIVSSAAASLYTITKATNWVVNLEKAEVGSEYILVDATASANAAVSLSQFNFSFRYNGASWQLKSGGTFKYGSLIVKDSKLVYTFVNETYLSLCELGVTPDRTDFSRHSVTLSASFSQLATVKQYSLDGKTWQNYPAAGVTLAKNGTVYFRAGDGTGLFGKAIAYTVSNIDESLPDIRISVTPDITIPTRGNVTLSAAFSSNAIRQEYSLDGKTWLLYTKAVTLTNNGDIYFRGRDAEGFYGPVVRHTVANIDRAAPQITVTPDIATPINRDVILTASFSDASGITLRQYRRGNTGEWLAYTGPVPVQENGLVQFRAVDAAGNETIFGHTVANIDRIPPEKPTASPHITTLTNGTVTVRAVFSRDTVRKEYSLNKRDWLLYSAGVPLSANGSVYFRGIDAAGNISEVTTFTVTNIDRVLPQITVTPDTTQLVNHNVLLTAAFFDANGIKLRQYRFGNSGEWLEYTGPVQVPDNGLVQFRAVDVAGNETILGHTVANIDRVRPEITVTPDITKPVNRDVYLTAAFSDANGITLRQYRLGNSGEWRAYTGPVRVQENGLVQFRAVDAVGNETIFGHTVANIDRVRPEITVTPDTTQPVCRDVYLTAAFSDAIGITLRQYRFGNSGEWLEYTGPVQVPDNGLVQFRAVDVAGNETIFGHTVANIDRIPPEKPVATADITTLTENMVTVSAKFSADSVIREYSRDNRTWLAYPAAGVAFDSNGSVYFRAADAAGNLSAVTTFQVTNILTLANPTVWTSNGDSTSRFVTLTAAFDRNSVKNEYSFDGVRFFTYNKPLLIAENRQVTFRSTNAYGKRSSTIHEVSNIRPIDPEMPRLTSPSASQKKYNVSLKWEKAVTSRRIVSYEIYCGGSYYFAKSPSLSLKNLAIGEHDYSIRAIDSFSSIGAWSALESFTVRDVTAPKMNKPTVTITGYSATITWSATDNVGIDHYLAVFNGRETRLAGSTPQFRLDGLGVGKQAATIQAFDAAGNAARAAKVSFTVKDATPPEKVTGLNVPVADAKYSAWFTWNPGVDNSGKISGYEIELDGVIRKSKKPTLKAGKLAVGEHRYRVRAVDATKNTGEWSEIRTFTVFDVTAPKKVSVKTKVTGNDIRFDWTAPKDNVGVVGYELRYGENLEHGEWFDANRLSFQWNDVARGSYLYELTAFDAAGNRSETKNGRLTVNSDLQFAYATPEAFTAAPDFRLEEQNRLTGAALA